MTEMSVCFLLPGKIFLAAGTGVKQASIFAAAPPLLFVYQCDRYAEFHSTGVGFAGLYSNPCIYHGISCFQGMDARGCGFADMLCN